MGPLLCLGCSAIYLLQPETQVQPGLTHFLFPPDNAFVFRVEKSDPITVNIALEKSQDKCILISRRKIRI